VVLHRGRIVGERYADGVTPATPLIGWSMTKSVTNALLGILVLNGKLDMYEPAPIAEWSMPGDPRQPITPDQLLRMVSGIGCGQSLHTAGFKTLFDADTHMEYDMADQSAFAANASLRAKPGSEWRYTNCNFVLLSRIIRNLAGGDANAARKFISHELFEPLGFEHATLEYDSVGVPLGTIHLWASARDWARFGLLYLRDGVTESGRRILPEGWVGYSARLTPQSVGEHDFEYGAGFWTVRGGLGRSARAHCDRHARGQLHGQRRARPIYDRDALAGPRDRQDRLVVHAKRRPCRGRASGPGNHFGTAIGNMRKRRGWCAACPDQPT